MSASAHQFNKDISLKYLGLPLDYTPSPEQDPISFLTKHIFQLPPHLLLHYSDITTPKQRTTIASIRNRRLQYANKSPEELQFEAARDTWPSLWTGRVDRRGLQEGKEEKAWAETDFLSGSKQHIGKLGKLLAEYEEERKAERMREIRKNMLPPEDDFIPEEDSDSDEEDSVPTSNTVPPETEETMRSSFERLIRERFVYGLLDVCVLIMMLRIRVSLHLLQNLDYDKVDWNEDLDVEDRDAQDRWFDEDEDDA